MSATNLITMVLVARAVEPAQFGVFVVAYTFIWVFQSIQRALILEPLTVLSAAKEENELRSYFTNTAVLQVMLALALGGAVAVVGAFWPSVRSLLLALALVVVFWQLQHFVRRVLYTRLQVTQAFMNDLISYGGQAVLLTALYLQGALNTVSALGIAASTCAVAMLIGLWQIRSSLTLKVDIRGMRQVASGNWRFGRWLLAAGVSRGLARRLTRFLVIALIGPAGVAAFMSASILGRMPTVLTRALETLATPLAARRLRRNSQADMEKFLRIVGLAGLIPMLLLVAFVVIFAEKLLNLVYGGTYDDFAWFVRIVVVAQSVWYIGMVFGVALKTLEHTRVMFFATLTVTVVTVVGGFTLISLTGLKGAAWLAILTSGVSVAALASGYWWVTRHKIVTPSFPREAGLPGMDLAGKSSGD